MAVRQIQGLVLVAGAVVFYLLFERQDIGFHWTPLVIGLVYLVAAALGGRRGSYWATAVALVGFGLGPVARFEYAVDASAASLYVIAIGLAVVVAGQLEDRGFALTQTAVGATILAAGVVFSLQTHLDVITEPALYAGFLAAVGVVRVAAGAGTSSSRRR